MPLFPQPSSRPAYPLLLLICCLIAFASYISSYMRIPVVPLFAQDLGAGTVMVGFINSAFLLMAGLFSFPVGLYSDRLGRKPLVLGGLAVSAASAFWLAVSSSPLQLVAIYLAFGLALAAVGPTLMAAVADISPSTHLGRSYGWFTTAIYGGMSLGPALGGWLAQRLGFRPLFLLSGVFLVFIVGLAAAYLPGQAAARRQVSLPDWPRAVKEIRQNRHLLGCWLATLGGCFGLGMFITFAPLHTHSHGLSMAEIGVVFGVQGAVNALSRIPLGRLSDMVSQRWRQGVLGLILVGASMAAFGLSHTFPHFLASAVFLGVSMALAFTAIGALIAEVVPFQSRGLAMGGYNASIYLGMMASSAAMGAVIKSLGFAMSYLLTGLVLLVIAIVFYLLIKDFSPEH
jgi:MFS transporter, DHA1 family, multidrug resistance protein